MSIPQDSQKIKIDASAMIDANGWPPQGFQATRVRLLEAIERADTDAARQEAVADWEGWVEDERQRFLFGLRATADRHAGIMRDRLLDVLAPAIAEAISFAFGGEATNAGA